MDDESALALHKKQMEMPMTQTELFEAVTQEQSIPEETKDKYTDSSIADEPVTVSSERKGSDLAALREEMAGLRRDFQSKVMYDAGKQRQLDTLHEELETYRRGFHFQLLRPVFTDLVALRNDMERVAVGLANGEQNRGTAQELTQFCDQIDEILRRNGVERFTVQGDEFDAKRQRVVATIDTVDPALDKRVAERLRPGYMYEERIVAQAEQVRAYRYIPTQPNE